MKKKIIELVNVDVKRLFIRGAARNYYTLRINLTTADNKFFEIHSKIHYGRGDYFFATSKNLLEKFGFENPAGKEVVWCANLEWVDRKKDLKHFDSSKLFDCVISIYE